MVCLGNICRSPLAHGILEKMVEEEGLDWYVDSAGTSGFHDGDLPDPRSIAVARSHGIDITRQRSRRFTSEDFATFDHILVMDQSNFQNVRALSSNIADHNKVELILNYSSPGMNQAVPDPYYEGGFEGVYHMLYESCHAFVKAHK